MLLSELFGFNCLQQKVPLIKGQEYLYRVATGAIEQFSNKFTILQF